MRFNTNLKYHDGKMRKNAHNRTGGRMVVAIRNRGVALAIVMAGHAAIMFRSRRKSTRPTRKRTRADWSNNGNPAKFSGTYHCSTACKFRAANVRLGGRLVGYF